jgi:hypothetical protein
MYELRVRDSGKDAGEIAPYELLAFCFISPETMLNFSFRSLNPKPDQTFIV